MYRPCESRLRATSHEIVDTFRPNLTASPGTAQTATGRSSRSATREDNTVTYIDTTAPTVTINQAERTSESPVNFTTSSVVEPSPEPLGLSA